MRSNNFYFFYFTNSNMDDILYCPYCIAKVSNNIKQKIMGFIKNAVIFIGLMF